MEGSMSVCVCVCMGEGVWRECVCACVGVWREVCLCVALGVLACVCVHGRGGQRRTLSGLSLEAGSVTQPGTLLAASKPC